MEHSIIKQPKLVVALDIGSTYSGYAWQWRSDFLNNRSNIEFNTNWGSGGVQLHKTATCILMNKKLEIDSFGSVAERRYCTHCNDMKGDQNKIRDKWYFFKASKMLLYNKSFNEDIIAEDFLGQQLSLSVVMANMIQALKNHFIKNLEKKGHAYSDLETRTLWVLTVPAIWSEEAKKFMRKAAVQSIDGRHLLLAHEPESAALYCMNLSSDQRQSMNNFGGKGDKFVVIDLGGGTVDILAIEVLDDGNVKEICEGSGDRVGGQDVNNAFFQCCKDVLEGNIWHEINEGTTEDLLEMEMDFENQKVRIGSCDPSDEEIRLKIPSNMVDMIRAGRVKIKPNGEKSQYFRVGENDFKFKSILIREILFEETVKLVLKSIKNILNNKELQSLKTMVLVGGFAESYIVVEKIKGLLTNNNIKVVVPTSPFRAILMGAVLFGHDPLIFLSRICRATYGISAFKLFDPKIHDSDKKVRCEDNGKDYCDCCFSLHVLKGQTVKLNERQSCKIYNPMNNTATKIGIHVYSSMEKNPKYTTDSGCKKVGYFSVNIPDTEGGLNRKVKVEFIYGGTELGIIATDLQTGNEIDAKYSL